MVKLNVCIGSACHIKGSYNVINAFQQMIEEHRLANDVELNAVFCLGHCTQAVSVEFEDEIYSVSGDTAKEFFETHVMPKVQK